MFYKRIISIYVHCAVQCSIRVTWSVSGWIVEQQQSVVMWNKISLSTFQAKHKTDVEVKVNFVNSVCDSMLGSTGLVAIALYGKQIIMIEIIVSFIKILLIIFTQTFINIIPSQFTITIIAHSLTWYSILILHEGFDNIIATRLQSLPQSSVFTGNCPI